MLSDAGRRKALLPGTDLPVQLLKLHRDHDTSTFLLVAFPPGWTRDGGWTADVDEEVLWLDGDFRMSGVDAHPGTHAWYPAGFVRDDSLTRTGALALAWFSGMATWTRCAANTSGPSSVTRAIADIEIVPGPEGTRGRLLRKGRDGRRTWLLQQPPSSPRHDGTAAFDLREFVADSPRANLWSFRGLGTTLVAEKGAEG